MFLAAAAGAVLYRAPSFGAQGFSVAMTNAVPNRIALAIRGQSGPAALPFGCDPEQVLTDGLRYFGTYHLFPRDGLYACMLMRDGRDGKGLGPDITASETLTGQIVVPRAAVHNGKAYVANAEDRLSIRQVEPGLTQSGLVIIRSGINAGDRVLVSDLLPAIEGMKLRVTRDEQLEAELTSRLSAGEAK